MTLHMAFIVKIVETANHMTSTFFLPLFINHGCLIVIVIDSDLSNMHFIKQGMLSSIQALSH